MSWHHEVIQDNGDLGKMYEVTEVVEEGTSPRVLYISTLDETEIPDLIELSINPPLSQPSAPPLAPLTRRQLRLGLLANGITAATVEAAIAAIPDPMDRAIAEIEWADASTYERDHHLIEQVGTALGLTPEQIDTMWEAALSL